MQNIRKKVLSVHGTILLLIGGALTVNSTLGAFMGIGVFSFLQENELALVGLFQAYLLMAIIGLVLWMGSSGPDIRRWHLIGAVAHVPPLTAGIMFWDLLGSLGMTTIAIGAITFHCVFILVESTAFFYPGE